MKPMIVDQNLGSNSFRNFFFEWAETLRQLPFISWLWAIWFVCLFLFLYLHVQVQVFLFICTQRVGAIRDLAWCNGLKHVCIRVWSLDVALAGSLCPYEEEVIEVIRNKTHEITITQVYCSNWESVLTYAHGRHVWYPSPWPNSKIVPWLTFIRLGTLI